jgi:O-antigen ligase
VRGRSVVAASRPERMAEALRVTVVPKGLTVVLLAALGIVVAAGTVSAAPIALSLCVLLIWAGLCVRFRVVLPLLTIVIVIAIPRYVYAINGVSVNAERLVLPLLAVLVAAPTFMLTKRLRLGLPHLGVALWILATALGSIVNAPSPQDSLRLTLLITIATLPLWLLPQILRTKGSVSLAIHSFVVVGLLEAGFGLLALILFTANGINIGVQMDSLTGGVAPYGSQYEGNIFGSFVGAAMVLAVAVSTTVPTSFRYRWFLRGSSIIMALAVLLSISRGAWLGTLAGLLITFALISGRKTVLALIGVALLSVALLPLFQAAAPTSASTSTVVQRMQLIPQLLGGSPDATTLERFYAYGRGIEDMSQHPIIGWGAGSLGQLYTGYSSRDPAWLSNVELHAAHDGGIVGLFGLLVALGAVLAAFRRKMTRSVPEHRLVAGLVGASVCLLVAFQATEATYLGYAWFVFGLTWTGARILGRMTIPATETGQLRPQLVLQGRR